MKPLEEICTQMMNGRLIWCLRQKLIKTYVENGWVGEIVKIDPEPMKSEKTKIVGKSTKMTKNREKQVIWRQISSKYKKKWPEVT